jgi:hypothetical protein
MQNGIEAYIQGDYFFGLSQSIAFLLCMGTVLNVVFFAVRCSHGESVMTFCSDIYIPAFSSWCSSVDTHESSSCMFFLNCSVCELIGYYFFFGISQQPEILIGDIRKMI